MENTTPISVTPLADIVRASQGTIVELPPFTADVPFVAKLKRPSMLVLVKEGKIPNQLLSAANELFTGSKKAGTENDKSLDSLFGVLDVICEACFVEPTYAQLKEAGVQLTDDQLMFVFNYTQRGVEALKSFRTK